MRQSERHSDVVDVMAVTGQDDGLKTVSEQGTQRTSHQNQMKKLRRHKLKGT